MDTHLADAIPYRRHVAKITGARSIQAIQHVGLADHIGQSLKPRAERWVGIERIHTGTVSHRIQFCNLIQLNCSMDGALSMISSRIISAVSSSLRMDSFRRLAYSGLRSFSLAS
ncbi:hypothetical protein FBZ92_10360 [Nitrospirillum viridazoti]|uniref:Uncharacterized protein n=1 Tax=Nitrospirillum amazonense TaxID=28077 RepID=A0A560IZG6_9PROT|nr:hypothetical protein FBZ92_10360 [Nitrospirillum amazonense]